MRNFTLISYNTSHFAVIIKLLKKFCQRNMNIIIESNFSLFHLATCANYINKLGINYSIII